MASLVASFLIESSSFLQVTRTTKSQMSEIQLEPISDGRVSWPRASGKILKIFNGHPSDFIITPL